MIWLTWRQFRTQAVAGAIALGTLAVLAILAGLHLNHLYTDSGVASCTNQCDQVINSFLDNARSGLYGRLLSAIVPAMYIVPTVIGVFWGAPLIARELESGTYRLAWNQSVTRGRWAVVKLAGVGLASVAVVGLCSLAVTWWAAPYDHVALNRMAPDVFGSRGVVPMGYAAFAFAVGVTAGLLLRRVVPAMAVTLVVVAAALIVTPILVRPHLATPVHAVAPLTADNIRGFGISDNGGQMQIDSVVEVPGAWMLSSRALRPDGKEFTGPADQTRCNRDTGPQTCLDWIASLHLQQDVQYQPLSRFWRFQWLETALYALVALLLSSFTLWWVRRRVT